MGKVELYEDIYEKDFSFGKNWNEYLKNLDNKKISFAQKSLENFLNLKSLENKVFVDIVCGSGLFSLCAIRMGAKKVISVDIDKNSVNCVKFLRKKNMIDEKKWIIKKGSALDKNFLETIPKADILYSWGVLHHTGNMWEALRNMNILMKKDSLFYLAIYNKFTGFPITSKNWVKIKRTYAKGNIFTRKFIETTYLGYYLSGIIAHGKNPYKYIKNYSKDAVRGMNFYRDAIDWIGGYPFEYASIKEIEDFYKKLNCKLLKTIKTNREGCNEFLFIKNG